MMKTFLYSLELALPKRYEPPDSVSHPGVTPQMVSVAIRLDLLIRFVIGAVHNGFPCVRVKMIHRDSTQVPDAACTPAQVTPDIIHPEMLQARLAYPAQRLHNITAHDNRFRGIFPDAIPGVTETRSVHVLDSTAKSLIEAFSPGNHVIPERREKPVLRSSPRSSRVRPC